MRLFHDILIIPLTSIQESGEMIYRHRHRGIFGTPKLKVWRWFSDIPARDYLEEVYWAPSNDLLVSLVSIYGWWKKILHHLGCLKRPWYWYKTNIWGILSSTGFFSSTVLLMDKAPVIGPNSQVLTAFQSFSTVRRGYRWISIFIATKPPVSHDKRYFSRWILPKSAFKSDFEFQGE